MAASQVVTARKRLGRSICYLDSGVPATLATYPVGDAQTSALPALRLRPAYASD